MIWTATSISIENNSTNIIINSGDDVAVIQANSWIKVANFPAKKILKTITNTSDEQVIILDSNWTHDSQTNVYAIAISDSSDLDVLIERGFIFKDRVEELTNDFSSYTIGLLDTIDTNALIDALSAVDSSRTLTSGSGIVGGGSLDENLHFEADTTIARVGTLPDQTSTNKQITENFYTEEEYLIKEKFEQQATIYADFIAKEFKLNYVKVTFDQMFTYTRNTTKTFFNRFGKLVTALEEQETYEYDRDGNPKGLSIGSNSTNLIPFSRDISKWTKSDNQTVAITDNEIISLDDTANTGAVYTSTNVDYISRSISVTNGARYEISFLLKRRNCRKTKIEIVGRGDVIFDWNEQSFEASEHIENVAIEEYQDNYLRLSIRLVQSGSTMSVRLYPDIITGGSVYVDFAQVELGSFVSWIETNSDSLPRASDSLYKDGTNNFNPNQGTIIIEFDFGTDLYIDRGALNINNVQEANDSPFLSFYISANTNNTIVIRRGSNLSSTFDLPISKILKIAIKYESDKLTMSFNGSNILEHFGDIPASNKNDFIYLGKGTNSVNSYLDGTIKKFACIPSLVTNEELQLLSRL